MCAANASYRDGRTVSHERINISRLETTSWNRHSSRGLRTRVRFRGKSDRAWRPRFSTTPTVAGRGAASPSCFALRKSSSIGKILQDNRYYSARDEQQKKRRLERTGRRNARLGRNRCDNHICISFQRFFIFIFWHFFLTGFYTRGTLSTFPCNHVVNGNLFVLSIRNYIRLNIEEGDKVTVWSTVGK